MKNKWQNGFTLLEVLLAITVFTIGILAATSMQTTATRSNASARVITEATQLAAQQAERLRDIPYGHEDLQEKKADDPLHALDMDNYQTSWTVQEDFPERHTKMVTIQVTGSDCGIQKTVTVERIIARGQRGVHAEK